MDSASGAGVRTHLRRGSNENTIHPLSVDMVESAPGPAPEAGRRLDQFRPFGRWFPWLVPSFIVANISMFIITMFLNNCPKNTSTGCIARVLGRLSFQPLKENPLFGPSSLTRIWLETIPGDGIFGSALFLHSTPSLGFLTSSWKNLIAEGAFCFGVHKLIKPGIKRKEEQLLEKSAGSNEQWFLHVVENCSDQFDAMIAKIPVPARYCNDNASAMVCRALNLMRIGVLYVLSGFGGSLLSALFIQTSISVGASGALFGLLGGMLSELITNWTIYANKKLLQVLANLKGLTLEEGMYSQNLTREPSMVDQTEEQQSGSANGMNANGSFVFLIRPQFGWISRKYRPAGYDLAPAKSKHKPYQYILWALALIPNDLPDIFGNSGMAIGLYHCLSYIFEQKAYVSAQSHIWVKFGVLDCIFSCTCDDVNVVAVRMATLNILRECLRNSYGTEEVDSAWILV
ncbi:hypothetical protein ACLOJK_012816 [Asimina triloba]